MKKVILAIVIAFGISACDPATIPNPFFSVQNPVTSTNFYEANLAYDGALKAFNAMKRLCASRSIPSSCRTYVIKGQQIIPQAESARRIARDFIRANPTLNASSLVSAFTTLVVVLQNSAAQQP